MVEVLGKGKLLLQLFGDGDGSGDGNGSGTEGGNSGGNNEPENKPVTFEEFLKQAGNQAEFDRRVDKAVQTAVAVPPLFFIVNTWLYIKKSVLLKKRGEEHAHKCKRVYQFMQSKKKQYD